MSRAIVCCIFQSPSDVADAIELLLRQGFEAPRLSIMSLPGGYGQQTWTPDADAGASIGQNQIPWPLRVRVLALPGVGPLITAGPIAESLRKAPLDRVAGRVAQILVGIGVVECDARHLERRIKDGGILLAVHCGGSVVARRAHELLSQTSAGDIAVTSAGIASFIREGQATLMLGGLPQNRRCILIPCARQT